MRAEADAVTGDGGKSWGWPAGWLATGVRVMLRALFEARSPESPGGTAITSEERDLLRAQVDELIHHLADVRARLGGKSCSG